MSAAAIVTLVLTGLLIAALAVYLIAVIRILHHVLDTLGKVTFGVRAIAHRTEPVGPVLANVNANLTAVADALERLVSPAPTDTAKV
jgi:hypothetical protein